ncbi:TetR/AcrR family transcriptional regulator [Paenarthrobacter sp. DKR-5]|uniref:TetR/AcrR family transcriptional regulator n=1 Tax=Paenarthrobacter sp. DKR-5 TaxID=2835535 RepID=UPI001BDC5A65|nr:TetR family transcriptional regulator [Paenarthrobacter sp. DKR-5]MBT1002010.1 TetR/AcrR family transcriptional regulator [Paenarthrobacter sp. DKR-5]
MEEPGRTRFGGSGAGRHGGARQRILEAARTVFAANGLETADYRQIARAAGVGESVVGQFFPRRADLLAACVELPINPEQELADVAVTEPGLRAEAVVRTLLRVWDSPAQPGLVALAGKAIGPGAGLMREILRRRILGPVMQDVEGDPDTVRLRGSLVASELSGLIIVRYLIRLDPLAAAGHDEIVRMIAPAVQHYLTGDLPRGFP